MTFLNPIYLWSCLGILIPIAIHLWSRRKVVKIKVGSTKFLQQSEPRQTSTLRPNELWLLFLRIMTLILLGLLISGPQLKKSVRNSSLLYIVEPSLFTHLKAENLLESIPEENIRLLVTKFPEASEDNWTVANTNIPNYWQLAQEMESLPTDSIVVFTKGFVGGIKGKRPITSGHINWKVLNSDDTSNQIAEAREKGDSLELLAITSDADKLQFKKTKLPKNSLEVDYNSPTDSIRIDDTDVQLSPELPLSILIAYQNSMLQERDYIEAAYKSIGKFINRQLTIETTTEVDAMNVDSYDISIWLGVKPQNNLEKPSLIYNPNPLATDLITLGTTKNQYFLTRSLNSENVVLENLPEKLLVLLNLHGAIKEKISSNDKRVVSIEELKPAASKKSIAAKKAGLVDISPWLWAFLSLILITERIIAKYRKQ